jgi:hypothetical protein
MTLKTKLRVLLEADKLWSVVSALSAAVAAIAAFFSVQAAREAANDSRTAGRPYFLISNEQIGGSPIRLSFSVTNLGSRPATDVQFLMLVADLSPSGPPTLSDSVASPNDVGPTEVLSLSSDKPLGTSPLRANMRETVYPSEIREQGEEAKGLWTLHAGWMEDNRPWESRSEGAASEARRPAAEGLPRSSARGCPLGRSLRLTRR